MAYVFVAASEHYIGVGSTPITGTPVSMGCKFNMNDAATNYDLIVIADAGSANNMFKLRAAGGNAGDPVEAAVRGGSGHVIAATSTGFVANTWYHGGAVFRSPTSWDAYINGGSKGSQTTSTTPTGLDNISIGRSGDSSDSGYVDGMMAEVAIWDIALLEAEFRWLRNHSPLSLTHRLPNLKLYRDLRHRVNGPLPSIGPIMTNNGASIAKHPPMIYAIPFLIIPKAAVVADPEGSLVGGKLLRGGLLKHGVLVR